MSTLQKAYVGLLLLTFLPLVAPAAAIEFTAVDTEAEWAAVLDRAAEQDAMIFVDVYADWCAPCKMMERDVFSDDGVADYFNQNFVNVRLDGETDFGTEMMLQYDIDSYPTFLFFNPDNELINSASAYMEVEAFLTLGQESSTFQSKLAGWTSRLQSGEMSLDEIGAYTEYLTRVGAADQASEAATAYLAKQPDRILYSYAGWTLTTQYITAIDNPILRRVLNNRDEYLFWRGLSAYDDYLRSVLQTSIQTATTLEEVDRAYDLISPAYMAGEPAEDVRSLRLKVQQMFYTEAEDYDGYARVTDAYIDAHAADDAAFIAQLAQQAIQEEITELYPAAERWAERAYRLDRDNTDYATLYILFLVGNDKYDRATALTDEMEAQADPDDADLLELVGKIRDYIAENRE